MLDKPLFSKSKAPDVPPESQAPSSALRALRVIAANGNVLHSELWPWNWEPDEAERESFLSAWKGAATVDVVDLKR